MSKDSSTKAQAADVASDPRPRTIFGIDSHARTTTVCALVVATGETETRTFRGNDYAAMSAWMAGFPRPARGVYEAGCTGFVPARLLSSGDVAVVPIAPSKMPTSSESRTRKNDRNDAARLARLALAGELREVWVPSEEVEGLRDLMHAIDDLRGQRTRAYQRVLGLLCRHGVVWEERTPKGRLKKAWGAEFWRWLRAVELADPASQAALLAAIRAAESAREQYDEVLRRARELAAASSLAGAIEALQCLKCVSFVTALAFCAEVGDFSRFGSGRKVTSWLGLAPSESSSALSTRLGAITRCGCQLLRSLLVEGAWAATRCSPASAKACPASVDPRVRERARTLSQRLCEHRRSLVARGVAPRKANAATAAELGRFMLFLGREQQRLEAAAAA
ncbi:MAG: IS110 family transposase [Olsenella sp.]|nr:IS110 family transposase [Olsenella sp.]